MNMRSVLLFPDLMVVPLMNERRDLPSQVRHVDVEQCNTIGKARVVPGVFASEPAEKVLIEIGETRSHAIGLDQLKLTLQKPERPRHI